MADNPNQPRKYDAVLGGQAPSNRAVLGGLEGVKRRLASPNEQQRIAALSEALKYGDAGLNLVIQALQDSSKQVYQKACWLLHQHRTELRAERLLQEYPPLNSAFGVDYTRLRDLLAAKKWQDGDSEALLRSADRETLAVMLQVCHQEENGWLDVEDIKEFPCTDLHTINRLWAWYSSGRFGFSIQKRIWQNVGGKPNASWETYCLFGECVGWRVRNRWLDQPNLTYTLGAPIGHLPVLGEDRARITLHLLRGVADTLFSRLDACQL